MAKLAAATRWRRLAHRPLAYPAAQIFRNLVYPFTHRAITVGCHTFFGHPLRVMLPSGMDLFLTGGKTHDSELRLARYLIRHLERGNTFLDVGAHYGYFSQLAARCVGETGRVVAFEAAPATYAVLRANTTADNMEAWHRAVSDAAGEIELLEFPNLYAEYNTLEADRYAGESWYEGNAPRVVRVAAVKLSDFLRDQHIAPDIIKIDVEGAEYRVISGLVEYLETNSPAIAMEYLAEERDNRVHREAETTLNGLGYRTNCIDGAGHIRPVDQVDRYLADHQLDSDNIVFTRPDTPPHR